MSRRDFLKGLGGIFVAASAPAIVRADSLMRWAPTESGVLLRTRIVLHRGHSFAPLDARVIRHFSAALARDLVGDVITIDLGRHP